MAVNFLDRPIGNKFWFSYGDRQISFRRCSRLNDINRVLIKVQADCAVIALASDHVSDNDVIDAVKKRSRWIIKQQRDFQQQLNNILPRQYKSGETHYYLGKQYLLKVYKAQKLRPQVKLLRGKLEVTSTSKKKQSIKLLMDEWYKLKAKEIFKQRLNAMKEQALWVDELPSLTIRRMKSQWGNCSPNGRLTLNLYLIKAPRECIDYVILHELCHLAEHNHSKRFYRLMGQVMPNWEKVKTRLDNMVSTILVTV